MKICTVGLGYIGLPTSAMFAHHGANVIGVDINIDIVNTLNSGKIHIEEPGLEELVKQNVDNGTFKASTEPENADVFIIAVPTPNLDDKYKSCDLTYVIDAVNMIIPYLEKGNVVILESTVAPRTTSDHVKPLIEKAGFKVGEDISLVHCPERVLPGQILMELEHNNRIVGGITPKCAEKGAHVYELFVKGEIIKTDASTAEMSKLMENTYRDVNIALANELTKICRDLSINVLDVIDMANKHPRVNIHSPGPGVGGHCLAVDPYFIIAKSPENANIISASRETNRSMPRFIVENVREILSDKIEDNPTETVKIGALGITYKGNVDDVRESPALEIIDLLKAEGFELSVHDPHVKLEQIHGLELKELKETVSESDLLLVLVDHNEFKNIDFDALLHEQMTPLTVFDTRNIIDSHDKIKVINFGNLPSKSLLTK